MEARGIPGPLDRSLAGLGIDMLKLKDDSRKILPGDVFVAVRGMTVDGHDHVREALEKGAALVICDNAPPGAFGNADGKIFIVEDTRVVLAELARRVFDDPSDKMVTCGVTGTNGKTTTSFLLDRIFSYGGYDNALMTTVLTKVDGDRTYPSDMTTPGVLELNGVLRKAVSSGKTSAVIEISSHALSQGRVAGISLDAAVFTNITPEHMDYHKDMDSYFRDKSRIISLLKPGGCAVLNSDDPRVSSLVRSVEKVVTFGINRKSDVEAKNVSLTLQGTEFDLVMKERKQCALKVPLIGIHNVYNVLAALACASSVGMDVRKASDTLRSVRPVPGRLEKVPSRAPFHVFVDYAHTPDALTNILECLKGLCEGKLICVFGCGGDRDKSKRGPMGRSASSLCDRTVITSDNPRTETPEDILDQIRKGVKNGADYCIIKERRQAIRKALEEAGKGDIVVVAGKGHEKYQIIGREKLVFDDKSVIRDILSGMGHL